MENKRIKINEIRKPAGWILLSSFLVSLFTLIIYLLGTGIADKDLFLLLAIMRYSSFTVLISSIFFLVTVIISLIEKRSVFLFLQVLFSVLGIFYGTGIMAVDAFITTISNG
jgi:hypothetical protein